MTGQSKQAMHRDFFWNMTGVIAQMALAPIIMILITRNHGFYASGMFSFAFAISLLMYSFAMWGGRTFQVSDTQREFQSRAYLLSRVILAFVIIIATAMIIGLNNYSHEKSAIIALLVFLKIIESIADGYYGVMQVSGRLYNVGRSLFVKSALGLAVFVAIDQMYSNVVLALWGVLLVNLLLFVAYDLMHITKRRKLLAGDRPASLSKLSAQALRILWRTWAVFAVGFMVMFNLNIPRYFIDLFFPNQTGAFGIIAMPMTVVALLMIFMLQPNIVPLAKLHSSGLTKEFHGRVAKLQMITAAVGLGVLLVTVAIGIPVLELIFAVELSAYAHALYVLIVGGIASALVSLLVNILVIRRVFKGPFFVLLFSNILLVGVSYLFVQQRGVEGGAYVYAAISLLQMACLKFIYRRDISKSTKRAQ
jgi:O-antigen/teichoic acid export membrane protein